MQIASIQMDGVSVHFEARASGVHFVPWNSLALRTFRLGNQVKLLPIRGIDERGRVLVRELLAELATYGSFCRRRDFPSGLNAFELRLLAAHDVTACVLQLNAAAIRTQWAPDPSSGIYLQLRKFIH